MNRVIKGVEATPGGARLLIAYSDSGGNKREVLLPLPTDRVLSKADIQRAIKGEMAKLALLLKRIRVVKDLVGTEVELSDDLL